MSRIKFILTILTLLITVALIFTFNPVRPASAAPAQQGELLINPGLEPFMTADGKYDYPLIVTNEGGGHVAEGWGAWWYNDAGDEYSVPEYDIAPITRDSFRVHSGNAAQQIFRPSVFWQAGIYQRAQVPTNSRVRFSIYGHTWATFCKIVKEEGQQRHDCNPRDSNYGGANPAFMRVGIDPTGGQDWSSASVVWSGDYNIHDNYEQLTVEATAVGDHVTVYTFTTFQYPAVINNVYWDDASLVVISGGGGGSGSNNNNNQTPNPTAAPNNPLPGGPGRVPTQPPSADGSQHHIVKSGETLGGIAVAYNVTAQEIRDLNGISGDLIFVGQDLLIKLASATPTPTLAPTATPLPTTPTPEEVAEVPAEAEEQPLGQICLTMFEDTNQNGLREAEEGLIPGGLLTVSGGISDSYTTDGVTDPFCFTELEEGDYVVSATAPEGYQLLAFPEVPVTVAGGNEIALDFGATTLTPVEDTATDETATTRSTLMLVGIIAGVLAVAGGAGFGVYMLLNRRRASIE